MVSILDEIIKKIKSYNFSIPLEDIRKPYSTKKLSFPMMTVDEVRNRPYIQIGGVEKLSTIGYRFEIYSRDKSINGKVYDAGKINITILSELDELLRTTYGLKKISDPFTLPYPSDSTVIRTIATYEGKIDNKTMIIYQ